MLAWLKRLFIKSDKQPELPVDSRWREPESHAPTLPSHPPRYRFVHLSCGEENTTPPGLGAVVGRELTASETKAFLDSSIAAMRALAEKGRKYPVAVWNPNSTEDPRDDGRFYRQGDQ